MAVNIFYTNFQDQPISLQQLKNLNEFKKVHKVDNIIKKIESFRDGSLYEIIYYKNENESISDILNQFKELTFLEIRERNNINSFIIENVQHYNDNKLNGVSKELFDQNNNLICVEIIDHNGLPIFIETEKDLYHQNEKILSFCYNEDGTIKYIWGDLVEGTDQRQKGSISADMINIYFPNLLLENPYYTSANFLPDHSDL